MIIIEDAYDKSTSLSKYLFELLRPRLSQIIRFKHLVKEHWNVEHCQAVSDKLSKGAIRPGERNSHLKFIVFILLPKSTILPKLIPIKMLGKEKKRWVLNSKILRFGIVIEVTCDGRL